MWILACKTQQPLLAKGIKDTKVTSDVANHCPPLAGDILDATYILM